MTARYFNITKLRPENSLLLNGYTKLPGNTPIGKMSILVDTLAMTFWKVTKKGLNQAIRISLTRDNLAIPSLKLPN